MKKLLSALAVSSLLIAGVSGCANMTDAQKLGVACDGFQAASVGLELYEAEKGNLDPAAHVIIAGVHAVVDPICTGVQPLPTDVASTITLIEQSGFRLLALKPVTVAPVSP
jgi:hypothetical protein